MPVIDGPRLTSCALDAHAQRLDFAIDEQQGQVEPVALRLQHRLASRTHDIPVTRAGTPGHYGASFVGIEQIAPGTWDATLVYPDARGPVAIPARDSAILAGTMVTVGDSVITAVPSLFGHLTLEVSSIYDVDIIGVDVDDRSVLLSLSAHRALLADDAAVSIRFNDITSNADVSIAVDPSWITTTRATDESSHYHEATVRVPLDEMLARLGTDGTFRLMLVHHQRPAESLAASIGHRPAAVGCSIRSVPSDLPSRTDYPAAVLGHHRIFWYRDGHTAVGLKVTSGSLLADLARIDIDASSIRFSLNVHRRDADRSSLTARMTNRMSGDYWELPVTTDGPYPAIDMPLASLADSPLGQDGQFDLHLRDDDGWLHDIGNVDDHQSRQSRWTFPSANVPTAPTQRIRPYFTADDTLALLSTPLLRSEDLTLSYAEAVGEAHLTVTVRSIAAPNRVAVPAAATVILRSAPRSIPVTAQQRRLLGPNRFAFRLTLSCSPADFAALADAVARAEALMEFAPDTDHSSAAPTVRLRAGSVRRTVTPRGLAKRLATRAWRTIRDKARLAFYHRCVAWAPLRPNTAVFQAFLGTAYADSPRAISETVAATNPTMKIYWVAATGSSLRTPPGVRQLRTNSLAYYWALATATYFVSNTNLPNFVVKRAGQRHLQTWHGTPLKRIGMDVSPTAPGYHLQDNPELHDRIARWDAIVSPSPFTSDVFSSAFGHRARVIERGYPRNDLLVRVAQGTADVGAVRARLGLRPTDRVVLYMPTWRDDVPPAHRAFLPMPVRRLASAVGPDTVVLLRLHYTVSAVLNVPFDLPQVRDVSGYEDSAELLAVADVLVTDYSSVFYDYSILERPIVFYAYDLDAYEFTARGFYWDFRRLNPWPIARDVDALVDQVTAALACRGRPNADPALAREFRDAFTALEDGRASESVVREFLQGRTNA